MANGAKTEFIINRLREPSTWAGIAVISTMFGVNTELVSAITQVIVSLAGVAAIFLKESK